MAKFVKFTAPDDQSLCVNPQYVTLVGKHSAFPEYSVIYLQAEEQPCVVKESIEEVVAALEAASAGSVE